MLNHEKNDACKYVQYFWEAKTMVYNSTFHESIIIFIRILIRASFQACELLSLEEEEAYLNSSHLLDFHDHYVCHRNQRLSVINASNP